MGLVIWHGSTAEIQSLLAVIETHCASECLGDQRFLDGVLFGRYLRSRMLAEEMTRGPLKRRESTVAPGNGDRSRRLPVANFRRAGPPAA